MNLENYEEKLLAYRAKKQKEEKIQNMKDKFKNIFKKNINQNNINNTSPLLENEALLEENVEPEIEIHETVDESDVDTEITKQKYIFYIMFFILWMISYVLFIKFQFGTVYLIVSALVFIYFNTRTGPKRRNEISAYSVFNKNCESIDGTLKAEQFEREIRYGAQNIH